MSGSDNGGLINNLAHPATLNLLGAYGQASEAARGIWANRLAQAQQASGEAYQGAINPDTGEFDANKYRQGLAAAGPTAALAAQSGLTANQQISTDQLDQARKKLDFVNSAAGGLLQQGQISPSDVLGVFQRGLASGVMTMPEVQRQLSTLPTDPAGLINWAKQHQSQAQTTQQQLEQQYGKPITVDNGQMVVGGTQSQQTGAVNVPSGQGVQKQTGPGENAALVEVSDKAGNKYYVPRSSMPAPSGVAPPAQSPLGTGRGPPPSLLNPNKQPPPAPADQAAPGATAPAVAPAPDPNVAPAAPGLPAGATLAAIGPAQQAAQTATGGQSAGKFQEISDQGAKAQSQNAVLGNMLADTAQFTTGPLNDRIKAFKSFATTYAPNTAASFGIDPKSVAANESFNKFAAQLADAQGAGSDARLAVNIDANPHAQMTPAGVDLVLRQLQGNADYTQARAKLAAAYPNKADREGFEATVGKQIDPRAFQFARMTVPQRVAYVGSLSKEDRAKVQSSYNFAHQAGLIADANAAQ